MRLARAHALLVFRSYRGLTRGQTGGEPLRKSTQTDRDIPLCSLQNTTPVARCRGSYLVDEDLRQSAPGGVHHRASGWTRHGQSLN